MIFWRNSASGTPSGAIEPPNNAAEHLRLRLRITVKERSRKPWAAGVVRSIVHSRSTRLAAHHPANAHRVDAHRVDAHRVDSVRVDSVRVLGPPVQLAEKAGYPTVLPMTRSWRSGHESASRANEPRQPIDQMSKFMGNADAKRILYRIFRHGLQTQPSNCRSHELSIT